MTTASFQKDINHFLLHNCKVFTKVIIPRENKVLNSMIAFYREMQSLKITPSCTEGRRQSGNHVQLTKFAFMCHKVVV